LRACRANFSQIFTVFRDEDEEALSLLEDATAAPAFIEINDEEGVCHQVWRMDEDDRTGRLAGMMAGKRLIIADGHHRYETALDYSKEKHASASAAQAAAYVSMVLFRSEDPGLAVLPVHRLLRRLPLTAEEASRRLERYFHVDIIQDDPARREGMFKARLESSRRPAFVMLSGEGAAFLALR
jgi:uncharacterized protein (DUF1015 family)